MHWLDGVLAVPLTGIQVIPNFRALADEREVIAPLLDDLQREHDDLDVAQDAKWSFGIRTKDGFSIQIGATDILSSFKYLSSPARSPGQLPRLSFGELRPYSALLDKCTQHTKLVFSKFLDVGHTFKITRVGIVAFAGLDPDSLPPGIKELFLHLGKPWNRPLVKCNTALLANLEETSDYLERCHHSIIYDETSDTKEMTVSLDWQRVLAEPVSSDRDCVSGLLAEVTSKATKYFARVAEGVFVDD